MKINKTNRLTPKIIIIASVVILLLLASGVAAYFFFKQKSPTGSSSDTTKIDYSKPTEEQKKAGEEIEKHAEEHAQSETSGHSNLKPTAPDKKQAAPVTISSVSDDGTTIRVRTVIHAIEDAPSTCVITITKGGTSIFSETVATQRQPSYTSCMGFDIPRSKLGAATGNVTVSVVYNGAIFEGNASSPLELK